MRVGSLGALVLAVGGCTVSDVDLAGKSCPCAVGWRCDETSHTCVHGAAAMDGGAATDGGGPSDGGPTDAGAGTDGGRAPDGGLDAGLTEPPFGPLYGVTLGGHDYRVPSGLVVELAAPAEDTAPLFDVTIADEVSLAVPPATSAYPRGAYLSFVPLGNTLSRVYRVHDGTLSLFATSDGVGSPDGKTRTAIFTPAGSAFDDRLYVTGISTGIGDGVFAVTADGAYERLSNLNNTYGLAYDCASLWPTPALFAAYNTSSQVDIVALDAAGTSSAVHPNFIAASRMVHLHTACTGWTSGTLFLAAVEPATERPFLRQTTVVSPWAEPADFLVPTDPVLGIETTDGALGDVVLVSGGSRVTAHFADGTSYVVLDDAAAAARIAWDELDEALYVVDAGASVLLRIAVAP